MTTDRQVLIGGEWVDGADGGYDVVNPATEEIVGVAPEASAAQALDAARAAQDAFPEWSQTTPEFRAELLAEGRGRDQGALQGPPADRDRRDRLHRDRRQADAGAHGVDALRDVRAARARPDTGLIPLPPQEMPATALAPGGLMGAIARRQPIGAVACITPYNFPIVNMAGKLGPALAMGNTVVVRPASQNPLAVIDLVGILHEVGFPPGVVNVVTGSTPATGEALVETRDIDMVSFTGSTGVGTRIAEVGGRTMKHMLLELGGKGAALVFDDADVKTAVQMIGSVWTFHSGQICTAPTRAIVQRSIYDQVVEGLAKMAKVLKVGDPYEPDTVLGPGHHRAAPRPRRGLRARRRATRAARSSRAASAPRSPTAGSTSRPR